MRSRAELNLTPLIDIVLVVLIIFLITATATHLEQPIELPQATNGPASEPRPTPIVRVDSHGLLFLDQTETSDVALGPRLRTLLAGRASRLVVFEADETTAYDRVIGILDLIHTSGGSPAILAPVPG